MKKFKITLMCFFSAVIQISKAQPGEIRGTVTDKNSGEPLPGALIIYKLNGLDNAVNTDENGFYKIKPLEAGNYDIKISLITYDSLLLKNIRVAPSEIVFADVQLKFNNDLPELFVYDYVIPLIPRDGISSIHTLTSTEIEHSVSKDISYLASTAPQVFSFDGSKELYIRGSRSDATRYIIDNIPVEGNPKIPGCSIGMFSVITGGIPAMYGDCTGGVIVITTKSCRF